VTQHHAEAAETSVLAMTPLLLDEEVAAILRMTTDWVRDHSAEIPGCERFGKYYRFHRAAIIEWLGSLDPLLDADHVAELLKLRPSWIYANADLIPGNLRLGNRLRFRAMKVAQFLNGTRTCQ
jgi:hypothetical protein